MHDTDINTAYVMSAHDWSLVIMLPYLIQGSTTALIEAAKKKYVDRRTNPNDTVGILAAAMSNQVAKVNHFYTTLIVESVVHLLLSNWTKLEGLSSYC